MIPQTQPEVPVALSLLSAAVMLADETTLTPVPWVPRIPLTFLGLD